MIVIRSQSRSVVNALRSVARLPADLRADPGSWLAVDAAPERDDLRAATRVTDVGSYR
jgi:hypothetical protein